MRPVIGVNMALERMAHPRTAIAAVHLRYLDAIVAAGGRPQPIPPLDDRDLLLEAVAGVDGFCFIGGPDYDPAEYGGHPQPAEELLDPRRHRADLLLARHVLSADRCPVLGICGGHQLINIALGGALVQDLPSEWRRSAPLPHALGQRPPASPTEDQYRHEVRIAPRSRLARILGAERIAANSFHHQALDPERLGRGLVASAWSDDGVIEAAELPGERLVVGIQWHPERQSGEPAGDPLFAALVEAARSSLQGR
ncbi:MAG: gamma-glutamyl-gamma-aminobutyrate hydrolase family protein [Planctomycetes bacterium]|nr:gamma-glutamyl-gamma-aminobutyrate hydrolase family protein [Planctomycetota bacterium]